MQAAPLLTQPLALEHVLVTPHCERRFQERCRPTLELAAAARELRRLIAEHGVFVSDPPAWLARRQAQEADAYLLIGADLVLPLRRAASGPGPVALTCLTRTGISEAAREFRNRRAQQTRARRRARRRGRRRG